MIGRHAGEDQRPVARDHARDRATCRRRGRTGRAGCRGTARCRPRADGGSVDSDSSTPARNAPIAIDRPPSCIDQRRAEHDQQRRRRHHLARLRVGEDAEHRVEQPAAGREQRGDRGERDADREPACRRRAACGARRRQERHERQQRHDGEVLEQQDRDEPLALRRRGVAALVQDLHDDGGRGEHEAHGGDERDQRRQAGQRRRRRSAARRRPRPARRRGRRSRAAGSTAATAASRAR